MRPRLPAFLVRGFRRPAEVAQQALGTLEREVMEFLWNRAGEATVTDVRAELGGDAAYTTLMTTLDRLYRKGLLARRKEGRAFRYSPRLQRAEFERVLTSELIGGLLTPGAAVGPILSSIVDAVSDRDRAALADLERLVREKRRDLKARDRER
jgi:predicted transcriptional regulator